MNLIEYPGLKLEKISYSTELIHTNLPSNKLSSLLKETFATYLQHSHITSYLPCAKINIT